MHPASTLQLLPLPRAMAERGVHVLCAGSRYARNDSPLIMEKVLLDLGAFIRHAQGGWAYRAHRARRLVGRRLAVALLPVAGRASDDRDAHAGRRPGRPAVAPACCRPTRCSCRRRTCRARVMLREWIDPSVRDEDDPDDRDIELDLYDPRNPNQPPYAPEYIERFRDGAARARPPAHGLGEGDARAPARGTAATEKERGFVTHRTLADPRFLDGIARAQRSAASGAATWAIRRRSTTVRSAWRASRRCAPGCRSGRSTTPTRTASAAPPAVTVPLLAIENTADDAVPQSHVGRIYRPPASTDKTFAAITGATHYYVGQPELLTRRGRVVTWLVGARGSTRRSAAPVSVSATSS